VEAKGRSGQCHVGRGNAAFKVIGGSLIPVALELPDWGRRAGAANNDSATTRLTAGAGVAVSVPTPASASSRTVDYKPLVQGVRHQRDHVQPRLDSGANANFGMFGVHLAYDSENYGGLIGTVGTFGLGAHVALKAPIGM